MTQQPHIIWDKGSAYDLFVSLLIIHRPDEFGLRPSWAAGVRSRLPGDLRETLEKSQTFLSVPMPWVYHLPEPKDAATALEALKSLPPQDRLPALLSQRNESYFEFLLSLEGKQHLTSSMEEQIKKYRHPKRATKTIIQTIFDAWSDRAVFGEKLLQALEKYHKNFFAEEEARIIPAQIGAVEKARALEAEKGVLAMVEQYSAGARMDWVTSLNKLIMAPSFWGAPFVFFNTLEEGTGIILFGARPKGTALVPGELVPEDLLNAMKALADPTRLRIFRHLQESPSTPSELAKFLRLRPPTVIHHLHILRLAGLVQVTVSSNAERRYAARMEGVQSTINHLQDFLSGE